jgi:hypothetical protein
MRSVGARQFLQVEQFKDVPFWVVIGCAITMAAGASSKR